MQQATPSAAAAASNWPTPTMRLSSRGRRAVVGFIARSSQGAAGGRKAQAVPGRFLRVDSKRMCSSSSTSVIAALLPAVAHDQHAHGRQRGALHRARQHGDVAVRRFRVRELGRSRAGR